MEGRQQPKMGYQRYATSRKIYVEGDNRNAVNTLYI